MIVVRGREVAERRKSGGAFPCWADNVQGNVEALIGMERYGRGLQDVHVERCNAREQNGAADCVQFDEASDRSIGRMRSERRVLLDEQPLDGVVEKS